jgi:hypothetical protein
MGSAEWAGVIPNVAVTAVDGIAGFTTYALTVTLPDTARNIFSIFGDEANAMRFPAAFQDVSAAGADIGGVSPAFWEAFPDSQYDSWLSVGTTEGQNGKISSIGVNVLAWDFRHGLDVADGAIFWLTPDDGPSDSEITIGQLTLHTGAEFTATANARGRGNDSVVDPDGVVVGDWLARGLVFTNKERVDSIINIVPAGTPQRFEPYTGNGTDGCDDVDECAVDNGGCDMLTVCINSVGSFTCGQCPKTYTVPVPVHTITTPYTGDGVQGCLDVDECQDDHNCDPLTSCINLEGAFTCSSCPVGYIGDGGEYNS